MNTSEKKIFSVTKTVSSRRKPKSENACKVLVQKPQLKRPVTTTKLKQKIVREKTSNKRKIDPASKKPKRTMFKRKCSKSQPLPPIGMGKKKALKKRITKQVKPRLRRTKTVSKAKNKITLNVKTKTETKSPKQTATLLNKQKEKKETLVSIVENMKEEVQAGVVFNPSTGCLACQEGRQGEGGKNCWGCRLRRMQNIQNIMPWNREERVSDVV